MLRAQTYNALCSLVLRAPDDESLRALQQAYSAAEGCPPPSSGVFPPTGIPSRACASSLRRSSARFCRTRPRTRCFPASRLMRRIPTASRAASGTRCRARTRRRAFRWGGRGPSRRSHRGRDGVHGPSDRGSHRGARRGRRRARIRSLRASRGGFSTSTSSPARCRSARSSPNAPGPISTAGSPRRSRGSWLSRSTRRAEAVSRNPRVRVGASRCSTPLFFTLCLCGDLIARRACVGKAEASPFFRLACSFWPNRCADQGFATDGCLLPM